MLTNINNKILKKTYQNLYNKIAYILLMIKNLRPIQLILMI